MVILTIAISGGPFLGLLGTVVGVMITFAAIAASGDVNVNAIAPGIAAARVATVAGLFVAIPALFGYNYLISRIKGVEIAKAGSGNVGATNIARVLGKRLGALTFFVDCLKGFMGALIALLIASDHTFNVLACVAVACGHCFSIPGKLKGGKGVATSFGCVLALNPLVAFFSLAIFAAVLSWKQIVSLASVCAVLVAPIFALLAHAPDYIVTTIAAIALLITWRHKDNLVRLAEGREEKFSFATRPPLS